MTGVILAVDSSTTQQAALDIARQLKQTFPGVTFAIIAGGTSSVAFEFDPPEVES